jgi:DnaK suppressor protein
MRATTSGRSTGLRQALNERREQVLAEVRRRVEQGRTEEPLESHGDFDGAADSVDREINYAILQMDADVLARIDEALVRLDAGRYGLCTDCGKGIKEQRLRALPFVSRCRPCQSRREELAAKPAPRRLHA